MTDYTAAFDESGGLEPLVKWGGIFIPGRFPITLAAYVIMKNDALPEFNDRWLKLRREIQSALKTEDLPPIHLRLMYGITQPPEHHKKRNPYLDASFEQIQRWIHTSLQIARFFSRRTRVLGIFHSYKIREEHLSSINAYFGDPKMVAELLFLKEHSKGKKRREMARKYLNKAWSPLLPLVTDNFLSVNETMRYIGGKSVAIKVDRFADSHGVDAVEVLRAIQKVSELEFIESIERVDEDTSNLNQLADLIAFVRFREMMQKHGFIEPDDVLRRLFNHSKFEKFILPKQDALVYKRHPQSRLISQPIHYAVARRMIEEADEEFAETHMVTVDAFSQRIRAIKGQASGISILKDSAVCSHLVGAL